MNINKIFNLFDQPEDDSSLLIDFSTHPLFWISGYNKFISNNAAYQKYIKTFFKDIPNDEHSESTMFDKAWDLIKQINLNNTFHLECVRNKASKEFIHNLVLGIQHFEILEEYEKCAFLKCIEEEVTKALI